MARPPRGRQREAPLPPPAAPGPRRRRPQPAAAPRQGQGQRPQPRLTAAPRRRIRALEGRAPPSCQARLRCFSPHPPLELVAWRSAVAEGGGGGGKPYYRCPFGCDQAFSGATTSPPFPAGRGDLAAEPVFPKVSMQLNALARLSQVGATGWARSEGCESKAEGKEAGGGDESLPTTKPLWNPRLLPCACPRGPSPALASLAAAEPLPRSHSTTRLSRLRPSLLARPLPRMPHASHLLQVAPKHPAPAPATVALPDPALLAPDQPLPVPGRLPSALFVSLGCTQTPWCPFPDAPLPFNASPTRKTCLKV